jgi:hypothetical protein
MSAIIDVAKAIATFWAFWVFASGLAFILLFRTPISAFLGRMKRVGSGQWSAEAPSAQESEPPPPTIDERLKSVEAKGDEPTEKKDPRAVTDQIISTLGRNQYVAFRENFLQQRPRRAGINARRAGDIPSSHRPRGERGDPGRIRADLQRDLGQSDSAPQVAQRHWRCDHSPGHTAL